MARTVLTAQQIVQAGLEPAYAAANVDGHFFDNDGDCFLHIVNADDDTDCVATVETPAAVAGLAVADLAVTVPFGEERMIGPLPPLAFNRASGATNPNQVYVNFDEITAVTCALLKL